MYKILLAFLIFSFSICAKLNAQADRKGSLYELVNEWPSADASSSLGQPSGLGIDSRGNLIIFHRAGVATYPVPETLIHGNTILKVDSETGKILSAWGADQFCVPHGLSIDREDNVWVTDVGLHQVFKFNAKGKLLMKLGIARTSGKDSLHFDRPTDVAVAKDGSFYVSDGYGNSRVIKFSSSGKYLFEWGSKGSKQGEFALPHGIDLDEDGNVFVADRENARIQKFDSLGNFLNEWQTPSRGEVYAMNIDSKNQSVFAVDYLVKNDTTILGSNISQLSNELHLRTQFGRAGSYKGPVCRYHDIETDNLQNIFVADLLHNRVQKFRLINQKQKD